MSTEDNDRAFIHGDAPVIPLARGNGIGIGGSASQYFQGQTALGGGPSADFYAAQRRVDNLRIQALQSAVGAQAAKLDVDTLALNAEHVIASARQFYAFLSGDTPISEG